MSLDWCFKLVFTTFILRFNNFEKNEPSTAILVVTSQFFFGFVFFWYFSVCIFSVWFLILCFYFQFKNSKNGRIIKK